MDVVTLNPYVGQDGVTPFLISPDKTVFILCATANPSIAPLQEYPTRQSPFYLNLVEASQKLGAEQWGLDVGGSADVFASIRAIAPEWLISAQAVLKLSEIAQTLYGAGRLNSAQLETLLKPSA